MDAEADTENVGTSWWTQVEFASALGIQVRKKALNKAQCARAHKRFEDVLDMVNRLNVVEQDFLEAMAYCEDVNTGLRGGDALHLAVAQRHGCTRLATLDTQMQANARRLGLDIVKF